MRTSRGRHLQIRYKNFISFPLHFYISLYHSFLLLFTFYLRLRCLYFPHIIFVFFISHPNLHLTSLRISFHFSFRHYLLTSHLRRVPFFSSFLQPSTPRPTLTHAFYVPTMIFFLSTLNVSFSFLSFLLIFFLPSFLPQDISSPIFRPSLVYFFSFRTPFLKNLLPPL